jgi:hypothetical protein
MAVSTRTYVKKVYPIKGRKDFFKYVVMTKGKIAKGWSGNKSNQDLYFDSKAHAESVATATRKVEKLNKAWASKKTSKKK